nr:MAG TPA: tail tape measure [Caudoviricetes sp.]
MASIEERIVSLKFDNSQFKQAASETIGFLDRLKDKLSFKGIRGGLDSAAKDADQLGAAVKNVDMSGLGREVEQVGVKFNLLQGIATGVMLNIGNRIADTGMKVADALSFKGAREGFAEYELQMGAVQTIMANTLREFEGVDRATHLSTVNKTLDELNEYADLTIYNFAEMTRNIGTFTAAGVDLKTSANAIKGIANMAAMSGSTSQQASTAMYQLSQAIAAGSVKLQDWNSVVNAGMGGRAFQEALWITAKNMGTLTEKSGAGMESFNAFVDSGKSFRESLSEGWITADVLTTTLEYMTGDLKEIDMINRGLNQQDAAYFASMSSEALSAATEVKTFTQLLDTIGEAIGSGWGQTWRTLIGDFDEAKSLFTGINNAVSGVIDNMSDARNDMFSQFVAGKGREAIIDMGKHLWGLANDIFPAVKRGIDQVFKGINAPWLNEVVHQIKLFVWSLKVGEKELDAITRIFRGLFSILGLGQHIINQAFQALKSLFGAVRSSSGGFLPLLASIGDVIYGFTEFIKQSGLIRAAFDLIVAAMKPFVAVAGFVVKAVSKLLGGFTGLFSGAGGLAGKISSVASAISKFAEAIPAWLESRVQGVQKAFSKLWETVKNFSNGAVGKAFDRLSSSAKNLGKNVANSFSNFKFDPSKWKERIGSVFSADNFSDMGGKLKSVFSSAGSAISNFKMPSMSGAADGARGFAETVAASMKAGFDAIRGYDYKSHLDKIRDGFVNVGDAVKSVDWSGMASRIKNGFVDAFQSIGSFLSNLGSKIGSFLGSVDWAGIGQNVASLLIKGILGAAALAGMLAKGLTDLFVNAFSAIDWGAVLDGFKKFGETIKGSFQEIFASIRGEAENMPTLEATLGVDRAGQVQKATQSMGDSVRGMFKKVRDFSKVLAGDTDADTLLGTIVGGDVAKSINTSLVKPLQSGLKAFNATFTRMKDPVAAVTKDLTTGIDTMFKGVGDSFAKGVNTMGTQLSQINLTEIMDSLGVFLGGAAVFQMATAMKGLTDAFKAVPTSIAGTFNALTESIKGFTKVAQMEARSNAILKMAISIAVIAGALYGLSQIPADEMKTGLLGLLGVFAMLTVTMFALSKMNFEKLGARGIMSITFALLGLAVALKMMTGVIQTLGSMDIKSLAAGLGALAIMIVGLVVALRKMPTEGAMKTAVMLMALGVSIKMLASAVEKLGSMDTGSMIQGLIAVMAIIAGITVATNFIDEKQLTSFSTALIGIATAMLVMSYALRSFSGVGWEDIAKGLISIGVLMGGLTLVAVKANGANLAGLGKNMILIAASLYVLAIALKKLSELSWGEIIKGLAVVGGYLVGLAFAMNMFSKSTIMGKNTGANILKIATSMLVLYAAIKLMSGLSWDELGRGIISVGLALAAVGIASQTFKGLDKIGLSLLSLSVGLLGLYGAVVLFGNMDLETLKQGLIAVAVSLGILAAAGHFLGGTVGALMGASVAMGILALSLMLLLPALASFAAMGETAIYAVGAFAAVLLTFVGVAALAQMVIPGIVALAVGLGALGIAMLAAGVGALALATALGTIVALGPAVVSAASLLGVAAVAALASFVSAIAFFAPLIGESLKTAFAELFPVVLEIIVSGGVMLVDAFVQLLIGIINAIAERIPEAVAAMQNLITSITDALISMGPFMISEGRRLFVELGAGILAEITGMDAQTASAMMNAAVNAMQGFIRGILSKLGEVLSTIADMGRKVAGKMREVLSIHSPSRVFKEIGAYTSEGLAIGIEEMAPVAVGASEALAEGVVGAAVDTLDINSPSKVFESIGENTSVGMANGIQKEGAKPVNEMNNIVGEIIDSVAGKDTAMGAAAKGFFGAFMGAIDSAGATRKIDRLMTHSKAAYATLVKEQKLKDIEEKQRAADEKERVYNEVEEARKALAEAKEDRADAAADARSAQNEKTKADKDKKKTKADATKDRRKAESEKKKISDAEKRLQKAEREKELYEYKMYGEEAGVAFVDGMAVGLIKDESVPKLSEVITETLYAEFDKLREKVGDFMDLWGGLNNVRNSLTSIGDKMRELRRALRRASETDSDKARERNLEQAADLMLSIGQDVVGLMDLFDKFKPYIPRALEAADDAIKQFMPQIAAFSPQLASLLGGGFADAAAAIAPHALAIGAIVAGVVLLLKTFWDLGGENSKLMKFLADSEKEINRFFDELPEKIKAGGERLLRGIERFFLELPLKLSSWLGNLITRLIEFSAKIPTLVGDFVSGLISTVVKIITEGPIVIIQAILDLIITVAQAIVTNLPQLFNNVVDAIINVATSLVNGFETILERLPEVLEMILIDLPPILFKAGVDLILALVKGVFVELPKAIVRLVKAFGDLAVRLVKAVMKFMVELPGKIVNILLKIPKMILNIAKTLIEGFGKVFGMVIQGVVTLFVKLPATILKLILEIGKTLVLNIPLIIAGFIEAAGAMVAGMIDLIAQLPGLILETILLIPVVIIEAIASLVSPMEEAGEEMTEGMERQLALKEAIRKAIIAIPKAIVGAMRSVINSFVNFGENLVKGFRDGITRTFTRIKDTIVAPFKRFGQRVKKLFRINSPSREFSEMGEYVMQGFNDGIHDKERSLGDRIVSPFRRVGQRVRKIFGINSPSRLFMEYGDFLMEGFAIGVDGGSGKVDKSMDGFTGAVNDAIDDLYDDFSDFDDEFKITPVVDLSQAYSGIGELNGLMSNTTGTLAATVDVANSASTMVATPKTVEESVPVQNVTNVNYEQNITAPNPLTAIEIYRGTSRQLDYLK